MKPYAEISWALHKAAGSRTLALAGSARVRGRQGQTVFLNYFNIVESQKQQVLFSVSAETAPL